MKFSYIHVLLASFPGAQIFRVPGNGANVLPVHIGGSLLNYCARTLALIGGEHLIHTLWCVHTHVSDLLEVQ